MSVSCTLPSWLERAVGSLRTGDVDGWMAIYTDDAIHEFPFAPAGTPTRMSGNHEVAEHLRFLFQHVRFGPYSCESLREVGDEIVVEATGHHIRVSDDSPIDVSYVWFITMNGGKVSRLRTYMDPLQLARFF